MHCNYAPQCTAVVDKTFKGYASVQLMLSGSIDLYYDDVHYPLSGAWIWTAWPGPRIRFQRAAGEASWSHRYVAFYGDKVWEWVENSLFPYHPMPVPEPDNDVRIFDELLRYTGRTDPLGQELAATHLELFLKRLKDQPTDRSATDQLVHEVKFRMQLHGHPNPNYARIAEDLKMAESTLRRRFYRATGTAIHTYFLEEKIDQAKSMLTNSRISIQEISDRLGYRDVFYFTRQFKKHVGTPPSTFRNSAQT